MGGYEDFYADKTCTRACTSPSDCGRWRCDGQLCVPRPQPDWQILIALIEEQPAALELAPWVAGGSGVRLVEGTREDTATFGAGVEGLFRLGRRKGCLVCSGGVRVGPWLGLDATSSTLRGEGGAAIDFGGGGQRSLSVEARGGGGRSVAGVSHVVGQLSVGYRFVQMRARLLNTFDGPPICPALVAPASGLRLVVSARRELEASDAWTLTLGLEWQPFGRRLGFPIW